MAIGTANMAAITDVLQEEFVPSLRKEFNGSSVLLDQFAKKSGRMGQRDASGEYYVLPLHAGGNESGGPVGESSTLPAPGRQTYKQAKFWRAGYSSRFRITGWAISQGKGQIINVLDSETKRCGVDVKRNINRMLHGDGSGVLATCVSASDSTIDGASRTTLTLLHQGSGSSVAGAAALAAVTEPHLWCGTQYLREGMPVAVLLRSSGNVNAVGLVGSDSAPVTIYSVDRANHTVVLSTTVAAAASIDYTYGLFVHGAWSATDGTGSTYDMYGLMAALSDVNPTSVPGTNNKGTDPSGLYGNINRSSAGYEFFKGNVLRSPAGAGNLRPISLDLIQEVLDTVNIRSSMGEPTICLAHPAIHRKLARLVYPDRRYEPKPMLDGGWKGFEFADVKFIKDKDAPPHTMEFLNPDSLEIYVEQELGIMNEDGQTIVRSADKEEYTGAWVYRAQLVCDCPNGNALVKDLEM